MCLVSVCLATVLDILNREKLMRSGTKGVLEVPFNSQRVFSTQLAASKLNSGPNGVFYCHEIVDKDDAVWVHCMKVVNRRVQKI
jgi:hypothetical protein